MSHHTMQRITQAMTVLTLLCLGWSVLVLWGSLLDEEDA